MAPEHPTRVPELMGYMVLILRASREFEGSAWAVYDDAYRRQAETSGQWQWSRVNSSLYSVCFTGKAAKAARCERCLSAGHATDDCSLPGEEDPDVSKRLRAIESAVVALTQAKPPAATTRPQMAELCRKYLVPTHSQVLGVPGRAPSNRVHLPRLPSRPKGQHFPGGTVPYPTTVEVSPTGNPLLTGRRPPPTNSPRIYTLSGTYLSCNWHRCLLAGWLGYD